MKKEKKKEKKKEDPYVIVATCSNWKNKRPTINNVTDKGKP